MSKIKSLSDLKKLKEEVESKLTLREKGDKIEELIVIKVAMATCGIASGGKLVMDLLIKELNEKGINNAVVTQTGCMGYCYAEPTVEVKMPGKDAVVFGYVDSDKALEIVNKYVMNNELVDGVIPVNYESVDKK